MKLEKIALSETHSFSSSFLEYMNSPEKFEAFYSQFPRIDNFEKQIKDKKFSVESRNTLFEVLTDQYEELEKSDAVSENISALQKENTFTVTTGHQLNIFTGPLYFLYKIVTVINICEKLKNEYPENTFVPIYWMASEDHDFEEISYFRFQGKKYSWDTEQKGAVGRFNPKEIKSLLDEFPVKHELFQKAYLDHNTLADSVRFYVNELFGEYGLVVVDADDRRLKQSLIPVMEADIFDHIPEKSVNDCLPKLEERGIKAQVNPRKINFFYLEDDLRTRIEEKEGAYHLLDSDISYSEKELRKMIHSSPEKFSPNVILRPLYQEMILPNLAYIGGPAEVVYWLELKGVFDHFDVPFPMVMPRNFAMLIPEYIDKKWAKTGLDTGDLFHPTHELARKITIRDSENDLLLNGKSENVESTFKAIKEQAEKIDSTLGPMVDAETKRAIKSLNKIEKKMIRAEKRRMSERTGQVESVNEFLFPGGGLQERKDNFLNFFLEDPNLINHLVEHFDPFDYRFHVLTYE